MQNLVSKSFFFGAIATVVVTLSVSVLAASSPAKRDAVSIKEPAAGVRFVDSRRLPTFDDKGVAVAPLYGRPAPIELAASLEMPAK